MKKSKEKYALILVGIVLGLAVIGSMGCKGNKAIDHKDSTLCAVYEGWPVIHDAEFETEAIFIPLADTSLFKQGQSVWIDTAGLIQRPMMRDAETKQFVDPDLHNVVIHERWLPNKYALIKQ
ncbi:MAG TPA: hypothetical protein VN698_13880 [Bacteroidia bacterium]|nr:hypothetical protein [Bacteroidia bacterium]